MRKQKERTGKALAEWREVQAMALAKRLELRARMREQYPFALLKPEEVVQILGTSRKKIRELELAGEFIDRIQIGPGRFGYRQDQFLEWMKARTASYQYQPKPKPEPKA
jgi:predicted DNA-binding transcriptional regulator AlpA